MAPGDDRRPAGPDTKVAADIIRQADCLIATINRYRLAIVDPDACVR